MSGSDLYPPPSYAAFVWLTAEGLHIGLPAQVEGARPHSVVVPIEKLCTTPAPVATLGWHIFLNLLRDRMLARAAPKIAERGAPVQYDIDEVMRRITKYDTRGREVATTLGDLGLED